MPNGHLYGARRTSRMPGGYSLTERTSENSVPAKFTPARTPASSRSDRARAVGERIGLPRGIIWKLARAEPRNLNGSDRCKAKAAPEVWWKERGPRAGRAIGLPMGRARALLSLHKVCGPQGRRHRQTAHLLRGVSFGELLKTPSLRTSENFPST
jgi:hypothetical protein